MMKRVLLLAAAMSLTACTIAPYKKPLDATAGGKLREGAVYAKVDDRGFGVQYFAQDSSAAGAPYGLIGALVSATMDTIANSGPLGIAQNGATKLAPVFNHEQAQTRFNESLQAQLGQAALFASAPAIQPLDAERKWEANAFAEPAALLTSVEYSLTQDLRSLEVVLTANVVSKDAAEAERAQKYRKPGAGMVYRNRLEYRSAPLEAFTERTQQEIDAEIEQIRAKWAKPMRDKTSAQRRTAMNNEIAKARKPAPPEVKAEHYLSLWLANEAALLRSELQTGLATVADLLARDLQDAAPVDPSTNPNKTPVLTADKRVVFRSNLHPYKGSLISEPVDYNRPLSNGVAYPRKEKAEAAAAGN
jgi:hypothetical protein